MQPWKRPLRLNIMTFCPEHPKWGPKSEIYTPKRDNEHPHHFHMGFPQGFFPLLLVLLDILWRTKKLITKTGVSKCRNYFLARNLSRRSSNVWKESLYRFPLDLGFLSSQAPHCESAISSQSDPRVQETGDEHVFFSESFFSSSKSKVRQLWLPTQQCSLRALQQ